MAQLYSFPSPNDAQGPALACRAGGALRPPRSRAARSSAAVPLAPRGQVDIFFIGRRLGRDRAGPRALVPLLKALIEHKGFPPPLDFRLSGGRLVEGADAVRRDSRWSHAEVEAWFDHSRPAAARAEAEAEAGRWAGHLDARAAELVA